MCPVCQHESDTAPVFQEVGGLCPSCLIAVSLEDSLSRNQSVEEAKEELVDVFMGLLFSSLEE